MSQHDNQMFYEVGTATLLKVGLIVAAAVALYYTYDIVVVFFVALVLAALITPLAEALERRRIPRTLTVLGVYVLLIALLILVFSALLPPMLDEVRSLVGKISVLWEQFISGSGALSTYLRERGFEQNFQKSIDTFTEQIPGVALGAFSSITGVLFGAFSLILIFVLAFYLVAEGDSMKRFVRSLVPKRHEAYVIDLLTRVQRKLGDWMRAQLILSLTVAVIVYIGLVIMGMPYALLLALLAGLLEFVPYAGPVIAAVPGVLIALSISPIKAALVLLVYVVVQQAENHLLVPKITQKIIGVNPIVSILALLLGARFAGFFGVLLAIPIAASLTLVVEDYMEHLDRTGNANATDPLR